MFRIAICDDEKQFLEKEKQLVSLYMKDKELSYEIDTFSLGEEVVDLGIHINKYKVIFLDISMKNINGIETAKKIRGYNKDIFIVFVTAYLDYALEGYKLDAVRYLLKGEDTIFYDALSECLDTIIEKLEYREERKIFNFTEGKKDVLLDHIVYIESQLHKLNFYIINEEIEVYTLYNTLDNVEREIKEFGFLRIHQSFLINLKYVINVHKNQINLCGDINLIIPRARYRKVKECVVAYKGEI